MNDAAVPPGLVPGKIRFGFQDGDGGAMVFDESECGGEAHDSAAHHGEIGPAHAPGLPPGETARRSQISRQ